MKLVEVRDGDVRYVPENAAEEALLAAQIQLTLGGEWTEIRNLRGGEPSGWEFRLELTSDRTQIDGMFYGYLTTRRAGFDPLTCLDGEAVIIELWVEWSKYWIDREPHICWRVPANTYGHAQENYLPHLPVLMAE